MEALFEILLQVIFEFIGEIVFAIIGEIFNESVNFLIAFAVKPKRTTQLSDSV